ncbi:hypothetical protein C8R44DRAFT_891132 [Mycena epipterygia]|nr:hypothetical protein C8R44DRAFT_891132 [Mycena epipterygia]
MAGTSLSVSHSASDQLNHTAPPPVKVPSAPDGSSSPASPVQKSTSQPAPPAASVTPPPSRPDDPSVNDAISSAKLTSPSAAAPPSSAVAAPPPSDSVKASAVVKSSSSTGETAKSTAVAKSSGAPKSTPPASPSGHGTSPSSVVENNPQISITGTTTSTITDAPESTLAKPSFISVVDSKGKTSFIAPPLVTILSTSRESNGSFVTFTHVVANPTGFSQAISAGRSSFFHNAGAVAGVFLVVGAILTTIAAVAIFFMCRRRRRRRERHRRWLISVNRPRAMADDSQDPFQDPRTAPSPPMRSVDHDWEFQPDQGSSGNGLGLYNVPQTSRSEHPEQYGRDFNNVDRNEIGLAISTNRSRPSLAQSSPSIYPPSLPPAANEDHLEEEAPSQPQRYSDTSAAPPRPRRSHLRVTPSKGQLITPPSSVSSHSPVSEFTGPFGFTPADGEPSSAVQQGHLQRTEIMGRRTLLDVRPRSQDSVAPK